MSAVRSELHTAYILHRRRFRETSVLLECLSAEFGRVGVIAKGALRRKRGGEPLQSFQAYKMVWSGKSELRTLNKAEPCAGPMRLVGDRLYSGFYVSELVMRMSTRDDPNADIYQAYETALNALATSTIGVETVLRRFEKQLLDACGYGLQLEVDGETGRTIEPTQSYYYRIEHGALLSRESGRGVAVGGDTLIALANNSDLAGEAAVEAKRLMRFILAQYLGDKPLASRALFRSPKTT